MPYYVTRRKGTKQLQISNMLPEDHRQAFIECETYPEAQEAARDKKTAEWNDRIYTIIAVIVGTMTAFIISGMDW